MLNRLWTWAIKPLFAPFKNVVVVKTNKPLPAALQPAALIAALQMQVLTWFLNLISRSLPLKFKELQMLHLGMRSSDPQSSDFS